MAVLLMSLVSARLPEKLHNYVLDNAFVQVTGRVKTVLCLTKASPLR